MKNPKVTVAMPAYNAERFLAASIESVLKQKGISFELIIYDDGSTDRTFAIAQSYAKDARVRIFRVKRNRGASYGHNHIRKHARGRYIAPHDSDDIMLAGRLAEGARIFDQYPQVGVVLGNAIVFKRDREEILGWASPLGNKSNRFPMKSGLLQRFPWHTFHGGVMFRKSVLRAAGGYHPGLKVAHDTNLLMRLWGKTRFYFIDRCVYVQRLRSGSLTDRLVRWDGSANVLTRDAIDLPQASRGVSFQLHGWKIRLLSADPECFSLLRKNLCCPVRPWSVPAKFGPSDLLLNMRHKSSGVFYPGSDLEACALRRWWEDGIGCSFSSRHAEALILLKTGQALPENALYHNILLFPVSFLLLRSGATLVHGALVSKQNNGILFMGQSGAGKSTLSVVFLRSGYRYYSDEHPIIQMDGTGVVGKSFPNRIALPAVSLRNFPGARKKFHYERSVGKHCIHPQAVWDGPLGSVCRVRKLIFPKFRENGGLTLKPLSVAQTLDRLKSDDYYKMNCGYGQRDLLWRTHGAILNRLAHEARGFELTYGPSGIPDMVKAVEKA
ncbi:MAG: glycosyltransferase [Candidatus Omnitrophota bacterium]|nr:glycosyltransferase [Candidatus Omnitrophota bacterium]